MSTFPSWGTWALCHKDAENAETCQFSSYVSCSKFKKLKLSKHLTPSIHLYSHVKHWILTTVYKTENTSKMSWCSLCVSLPQELVGHYRKQRSSFHRGKRIHVKNYVPWLCFNAGGCPPMKRKRSLRLGKEVFASSSTKDIPFDRQQAVWEWRRFTLPLKNKSKGKRQVKWGDTASKQKTLLLKARRKIRAKF